VKSTEELELIKIKKEYSAKYNEFEKANKKTKSYYKQFEKEIRALEARNKDLEKQKDKAQKKAGKAG
jgi:predicted  nucleic acid-binding Zn-ribbon protein